MISLARLWHHNRLMYKKKYTVGTTSCVFCNRSICKPGVHAEIVFLNKKNIHFRKHAGQSEMHKTFKPSKWRIFTHIKFIFQATYSYRGSFQQLMINMHWHALSLHQYKITHPFVKRHNPQSKYELWHWMTNRVNMTAVTSENSNNLK